MGEGRGMALEEEQAYYEANRAELLKEHPGKFALIKGSVLIGAFDTAENAYVEGLKLFGNTPFMVKQTLPQEPIAHLPALSLGLLRAHP
jgi:Flp pilus assembly protein TadD